MPTAINLVKWGRIKDPLCPLCQKAQTNKHVLSNCSSKVALDRYKQRHDHALSILTDWFATVLKPGNVLHVDLDDSKHRPITEIFTSLRPDIVIVGHSSISAMELTICHETNLQKSKQYKTDKYAALSKECHHFYRNYSVKPETIEV